MNHLLYAESTSEDPNELRPIVGWVSSNGGVSQGFPPSVEYLNFRANDYNAIIGTAYSSQRIASEAAEMRALDQSLEFATNDEYAEDSVAEPEYEDDEHYEFPSDVEEINDPVPRAVIREYIMSDAYGSVTQTSSGGNFAGTTRSSSAYLRADQAMGIMEYCFPRVAPSEGTDPAVRRLERKFLSGDCNLRQVNALNSLQIEKSDISISTMVEYAFRHAKELSYTFKSYISDMIKNDPLKSRTNDSIYSSELGVLVKKKYAEFFIPVESEWKLRFSEEVLFIQGSYFLKGSNLLVEDFRGDLIIKSEALELCDGTFSKRGDYVVEAFLDWETKLRVLGITGKHHVRVGNRRSPIDIRDPRLVLLDNRIYDHLGYGGYFFKEDITKLDGRMYGRNFHAPTNMAVKCNHSGRMFFYKDVVHVGKDNKGNLISVNVVDAPKVKSYIKLNDMPSSRYRNEMFNPNFSRVLSNEGLYYSEKLGVWVSDKEAEDRAIDHKESIEQSSSSLMSDISSEFGAFSSLDCAKNEKVADSLSLSYGDIAGGEEYFSPTKVASRAHVSQSLSMLGGKNYTFGIEHESCAGIFPDYMSEEYGLTRVGDGSTRFSHRDYMLHYEYVTSVLHGDLGVKRFYEYLPKMQDNLIFNDRCSTHIHVGGSKAFGRETDVPAFNRNFSALAIVLGAQVEDSLAALLPNSRNPRNNHYCGSIKEFDGSDISTKKNINDLIGRFVFSNNQGLGPDQNVDSQLGKWTRGRYKWLNLVNCNTNNARHRSASFSTIEFRIFPPSYNPKKVHFWVLIAQAFVWFVENKPKLILEGGLSIQDVLYHAYKGKKINKFVLNSLNESK